MIAEHGWDFYERLWRPGQLVVSDMERNGVKFDRNVCEQLREEFTSRAAVLEVSLNLWAKQEIKWTSWQQKEQFLYGTSICPATKKGPPITPKGFDKPPVAGSLTAVKLADDDESCTSAASIKHLADHCEDKDDREGLRTLLQFTQLKKLISFCKSLPEYADAGDRIHPKLSASTKTGRLSSQDPNLQNIPVRTEDGARLREMFIPANGKLLLALDFSGLEWRILAHCVATRGDTSLVDEIKAGVDPHIATAVEMGLIPGPAADRQKEFEATKQWKTQRNAAKILNYRTNYGGGAQGLGVNITDDDGEPIGTERGKELLDTFFRARSGITKFHNYIVAYARRNGYVRSLLGRTRYIDTINASSFGLRNKGERSAKNVIQDCATDVVWMAMVKCHAALGRGEQLNLQIHDELLFEVDEGKAEAAKVKHRSVMESCLEGLKDFRCPLEVSGGYGPTWGSAK